MKAMLRTVLSFSLVSTILLGLLYPLLVTAMGQALFPFQASGSIVERNGQRIGSTLIGQGFSQPGYFWDRPSSTAAVPYDGGASGGSNLGPSSPTLWDAVRSRIEALRARDPGNAAPIPVDLVTASGSGLDPHISPAAALYQVSMVARERGVSEPEVRRLVEAHIEGRDLGILGEPRVNVLRLNLDLEELASGMPPDEHEGTPSDER